MRSKQGKYYRQGYPRQDDINLGKAPIQIDPRRQLDGQGADAEIEYELDAVGRMVKSWRTFRRRGRFQELGLPTKRKNRRS